MFQTRQRVCTECHECHDAATNVECRRMRWIRATIMIMIIMYAIAGFTSKAGRPGQGAAVECTHEWSMCSRCFCFCFCCHSSQYGVYRLCAMPGPAHVFLAGHAPISRCIALSCCLFASLSVFVCSARLCHALPCRALYMLLTWPNDKNSLNCLIHQCLNSNLYVYTNIEHFDAVGPVDSSGLRL